MEHCTSLTSMALHMMERGATKHCDDSAMLLALPTHCRHLFRGQTSNGATLQRHQGCPGEAAPEGQIICAACFACRAKVKLTCTATANPIATQQDLLDSLGKAAPKVCLNTVTRALRSNGLHARRPRKVPLKTKSQCLKFACDHLEDSEGDWRKVIWSDETKIELFRHNTTKTVGCQHISLATPSPQSSMVVGASCCGGVSLLRVLAVLPASGEP